MVTFGWQLYQIALIYRVGIILVDYSAVWSFLAVQFGRPVFIYSAVRIRPYEQESFKITSKQIAVRNARAFQAYTSKTVEAVWSEIA